MSQQQTTRKREEKQSDSSSFSFPSSLTMFRFSTTSPFGRLQDQDLISGHPSPSAFGPLAMMALGAGIATGRPGAALAKQKPHRLRRTGQRTTFRTPVCDDGVLTGLVGECRFVVLAAMTCISRPRTLSTRF